MVKVLDRTSEVLLLEGVGSSPIRADISLKIQHFFISMKILHPKGVARNFSKGFLIFLYGLKILWGILRFFFSKTLGAIHKGLAQKTGFLNPPTPVRKFS